MTKFTKILIAAAVRCRRAGMQSAHAWWVAVPTAVAALERQRPGDAFGDSDFDMSFTVAAPAPARLRAAMAAATAIRLWLRRYPGYGGYPGPGRLPGRGYRAAIRRLRCSRDAPPAAPQAAPTR